MVKADGLAAGKGVFVAATVDEALAALAAIMIKRIFDEAGDRVVIEEKLEGEEASFIAFSDGTARAPPGLVRRTTRPSTITTRAPIPAAWGPIHPRPVVTPQVHERIMQEIMIPTVKAMAAEGYPLSRGALRRPYDQRRVYQRPWSSTAASATRRRSPSGHAD